VHVKPLQMSAYSRQNVAELRQLCVERGININVYCTKKRMIEALKDVDLMLNDRNMIDNESDNDDVESVHDMITNNDDDDEIGFRDRSAVRPTRDDDIDQEGVAIGGHVGEESETVTALRLKLQLVNAERAAREREWEIERQRIELLGSEAAGTSNPRSGSVEMREIRGLLPQMADGEVLTFFQSFERILRLNNVDCSLWGRLLPGLLSSRALKVFNRLSVEQARNYETIKSAILDNYDLGATTYLKSFRTMRRTGTNNYVTHLHNMRETLERYVNAAGITDFQTLFDDMLKQQFMQSLPSEVKAYVMHKQCKTAQQSAEAADLSFQIDKVKREDGIRQQFGQVHSHQNAYRPPSFHPQSQTMGRVRQPIAASTHQEDCQRKHGKCSGQNETIS